MSDITNLNIVTLGRARMGKSSLLNYLVGKDRFKAAPGNTVTGEGFYYEKSKIDGINVTFIDSYGIESGSNFKKWEKLLDKKLKEHDLSDDMNEWLHIVIYCLSGEDKGVQPIDTEIINKFSQSGTRVIIAITHSDCCSEQDGRIMKDVVLASCHSVREQDFVEICSVNRTGMDAQEFSGGGLRNMIIQQCNENILRKLPAYCTKLAIEKINTFEKDIKQQIEYNRKYSLFSESDHALWLKQECEHFVKGFGNVLYPQIIDHAVQQCKKVSEQLGQVLAQGKNKLGDNIKFQTNLLGPSVSLYDDYDSVFEKIGKTILAGLAIVPVAVFVIADELINGADRIKSELKRSLYDFCSQLKQQVEKNESKLKDKLNDVKLMQ